MTVRYDLLTEPWIPCEKPDGAPVLVGIEEALVGAHNFVALHDESPLVTVMLHRLLLAILQRVFVPRTMGDWLVLWEAGAFDTARVCAYLTRWKDRFDLFHPERPFLQVANLEEILRKERGKDSTPTCAWRLAMETSTHSNATELFEPLPPDPALTPARAATALLGFLGFTSGGRIQNDAESWSGGNVRGGATVVVRADTLHQTLILNLVWRSSPPEDDRPPWERNDCTQRAVRPPFGLVDQLVWPSRRVQLFAKVAATGGVVVREVLTAAGERYDDDHPDPMFAYSVRFPKKPPVATRIDPDRSAWRDSTALFELAADTDRRPQACRQLAVLIREAGLSRALRLRTDLMGLASDQAVIRLWRAERLPLPPALLVDGERVAVLRSALEIAEKLGDRIRIKVLRVLAENALAPGEREAHAADVANLRDALGAIPAFWAALGQLFPHWLAELGRAEDLEVVLARWKHSLRSTARDVLKEAERRLGSGARALQAGAKARLALARVLNEVLGGEEAASKEQSHERTE